MQEIEEKFYKTELVASYVEVCNFGGFEYSEVFEFASFVSGIEINPENIHKYRELIMKELNKQYPELKRHIYLANGNTLNNTALEAYKFMYKKNYGNYILIKSPIKEKQLINKKIELKRKYK